MNKTSKIRSTPIIKVQKDILLEFMQTHPELKSGRFTSTFTFKKAKELWAEITDILNAIPTGSKKDWRQWRKTWQDYKKNIKSKVAQYNVNVNQTGGGPPPPSPEAFLEPQECKMLNLLSNIEVHGLSSVTECGTDSFVLEDVNQDIHIPLTLTKNEEIENVSLQAESVVEDNVQLGEDVVISQEHSYNLRHPSPSTSRMKKTPLKLTKTRRLENSLKLSQNLLKSVNTKDQILEHYYSKKIEYMEHKKNMNCNI